MPKIKILLADDQEIVREGLKAILALDGQMEIAAEAKDGAEALAACSKHSIDIVLMDIRMPGTDGVEGTRLVREKFPDTKVIILTTFEEDEYITKALRNGASGYLLKDAGAKDIISAIYAVNAGSVLMHPRVASRVMSWANGNDSQSAQLTAREEDIVSLVAEGLSNQEIAAKLFISLGTVKNHLTVVFEKLSVRDRVGLAIWARERRNGKRS